MAYYRTTDSQIALKPFFTKTPPPPPPPHRIRCGFLTLTYIYLLP
jgi:hypothetical protein